MPLFRYVSAIIYTYSHILLSVDCGTLSVKDRREEHSLSVSRIIQVFLYKNVTFR
jgi:hypothetical protein